MSFMQHITRFSLLLGAFVLLGGAEIAPGQAIMAFAAQVKASPLSSKLSDYAVSKLDDFETTMKAVYHDDNAARKINNDIGMLYQLKGDVLIRYKEENKFRADGKLGASKASLVINDARQTYSLAGFGIKQTTNMGKAPGKRKSLLDVGLISEYYLGYAQGEFLGEKPFEGVQCAVFKITYKDRSLDTSHRIVWIDPKTKITLKREEYAQEGSGGKLRSIWLYREPVEIVSGLFFPSRIELLNNENKKAGETSYSNTRVNVGLHDDIFRL